MNGVTPVTVSGGVATFTTSTLPAGNHTITANYLGDTNFSAVSGISMTGNPEVIGGASSTTTVSPASGSVTLNSSDSISASVSVSPNSITTIAGTVAIQDNGSTISGCGALALGAGNPATTTTSCNYTLTTAGTHNITAVYSGTTGIGGGTSAISAVTVTKGTVTLSALGASSAITYGAATTYTVSVTTTGTSPVPGAFVQFFMTMERRSAAR